MPTIKEQYLALREQDPERTIASIARELDVDPMTLYVYNWREKNPEKQRTYEARHYYKKRALERIES